MGREELELSKFKKIFNKTIKAKLSTEDKEEFFKAVTDDAMQFVLYEKFNRLCDLFFFTPGGLFKAKNDSHQLYLIMTSMQRDRP